MHIRKLIFYVFIFSMVAVIGLNIASDSNYLDSQVDERVYKKTIEIWTRDGIDHIYGSGIGENKPISFLFIQKLVSANATYTKLINTILILINTVLIYRYTKNDNAYLYPIIYVFLNSLWLTVEVIETLFIILALSYQKYSGWFIGMSAIFRPYGLIYSVLLEKRHIMQMGVISGIFGAIMYSQGILLQYVNLLFIYGTSQGIPDILPGIIIVPMIVSSLLYGDRKLTEFGIVSMIPLMFRQYAHYYIPCYTLFFMSYLKKENEEKRS